jgi:molybdopterin synthase sulfur carrier subunit
MVQVSFTANLQRHLPCPAVSVNATTVRDALEAVFVENPALRSYLLDDQSRLRRHVMVFINDRTVTDRTGLSDGLSPDDEVLVFQALTGG